MWNQSVRVAINLAVALSAVFAAASARAQGLVVDGSGYVGIGTSTPAYLLVVDGGSSNGQLMTLTTTGNSVKFGLDSGSYTWTVANQSSGKFRIREDSSAIALELDPSGNLVLAGSVTSMGCNCSSAREEKTDIVPVNEREILDAVGRLPVFKWRYKKDASMTAQIGPMAEDFRDTFGIGDGTHLSLVAANGLSFAAIKGLRTVVSEESARLEALVRAQDAELEGLRHENVKLADRLAALEKAK